MGIHWKVWESWGADRWVVEVLWYGYCVPFLATPHISNVPIPLPSYSSSIKGLALSAAVADLRAKRAIEPAPPSPGFYSRLFVTPKVTGGCRPVIDFSRLNRSVRVSHFHMETQPLVLQSLRPGDWMVSLDLRDAYLQVPVHPESRCYLRFYVGEEVFQFRSLCFGLSTALQAFTRVMAPISSIIHRHGFRILRYLDDWLVLGSSFQVLVRARYFLLWLCQELGVQVNLEKSSRTPTQTLDYLGMRLQTLPLRVFPTPKRVLKLPSLVADFASCPLQPLALWRQLLGVMSSLSSIVSWVSSQDAVSSALSEPSWPSSSRLGQRFLGCLLPKGPLVVVRRVPSSRRPSTRSLASQPVSFHGCLGFRLGGLLW